MTPFTKMSAERNIDHGESSRSGPMSAAGLTGSGIALGGSAGLGGDPTEGWMAGRAGACCNDEGTVTAAGD